MFCEKQQLGWCRRTEACLGGAEQGEAEASGTRASRDRDDLLTVAPNNRNKDKQPSKTRSTSRHPHQHATTTSARQDNPPAQHNMGSWDRVQLDAALAALSTVTPAQWCQAFFLLAAGGVLAVAAMPRDAKALLVDYGARKAQTAGAGAAKADEPLPPNPKGQQHGWLLPSIAAVTSWTQVPHAWFGAFYAVSLACSVFWLAQYLGDGAVLRFLVARQVSAAQAAAPSATAGQVALGWLMMFLQAARRVFEHATVVKSSKSTMWVAHWVLGLLFYLFISVAVWVEGSGMAPSAPAGQPASCETKIADRKSRRHLGPGGPPSHR